MQLSCLLIPALGLLCPQPQAGAVSNGGGLVRPLAGAATQPIESPAFSADGKLLAFRVGNSIHLWDLTRGEQRHVLPLPKGMRQHLQLTFSPDSKILLAPANYPSLLRWDATTGKELPWPSAAALNGPFIVSADGKRILAAHGNSVAQWDIAAGTFGGIVTPEYPEKIREFTLPYDALDAVTFSPDGRWLVVAHSGCPKAGGSSVALWDVAQRKKVADLVLRVDLRQGNSFAFTPDSATLAVNGRTVSLFETTSGREIRSLRTEGVRRGGAVAFQPGTRALLVSNPDGTVTFWSLGCKGASPRATLGYFRDGNWRVAAGDRYDGLSVWPIGQNRREPGLLASVLGMR